MKEIKMNKDYMLLTTTAPSGQLLFGNYDDKKDLDDAYKKSKMNEKK